MKYNLFEINERLRSKKITSEQAHKELLDLFENIDKDVEPKENKQK